MDIREAILEEHSKPQALRITEFIGEDPQRYQVLVDLFLNGEDVVVQRAAWVISHSADVHPELVVPHLAEFIAFARNPPHVAVKRNVTRVMQFCELPEDIEGHAYDLCWDLARSTKEDLAVRANSLTVLTRIAMIYPELAQEVLTLAQGFVETDSAALKSRGRRSVKQLQRKLKNSAS